jgi:hypothetical protein
MYNKDRIIAMLFCYINLKSKMSAGVCMRSPAAMARKTHFRVPFTNKLTFEIVIIIGKFILN